jgi:clan AA aspartic protease
MMLGAVRDLHLLLPVTIRLPGLRDVILEFVIDTGFTGGLALPPDAVAALGLPFLHQTRAKMADASFVEMATHSLTIVWKGNEVVARVLATGDRPLLGTALLDGSELLAQFRENGLVRVTDIR